MDTTQTRWNVVNKPYIVLLKNMALSGAPFFFCYGSPLWVWSLETMELFIFLFFACVQASFFLLDSSMPPFSKGFWGYVQDMVGVIILKGHICGQDKIKDMRTTRCGF